MRIWHMGAAADPHCVDGVSRSVWLLALEQARGGHDVAMLLDFAPTPEAVRTASDAGVRLVHVGLNFLKYNSRARGLLKEFRPQVVHMHSVFIPQQALMARALRGAGVPYVITPHAGLAPQVLARGRTKKSIYTRVAERSRFMRAAALALVTPAEEKAVRAYVPGYEGIVRWMPNPIDFGTLDPYRWEGVRNDAGAGGEKRLIFLGRLDVLVKGVDILMEIARRLPEVKVELYGPEDFKTRGWLLKLKREHPANVSFHDPVFGAAKAQALARASMYVQPSRWEGFPLSVSESLYMGVPSAVTRPLDIAQVFEQHDLGLVISPDPGLAAAQIREALEDRERLKRWSSAGREFALRHFAPAAAAAKYVGLYEQVLEGGAAGAGVDEIHGKLVNLRGIAVSAALPERAGRGTVNGGVNGRINGNNGNGHVNGHGTGNGHGMLHPGEHHSPPGETSGPGAPRRFMGAQFRGALKQNVSRLVERGNEIFGDPHAARSVLLCYHSISDLDHGLTIAPAAFRDHLRTLRKMGFGFQTLGEFVHRVLRWGTPRQNVAVITFDDGYEDNLNAAAPILAEQNVPATFFITTGLMQRDPAVIDSFRRLTRYDATYLSAQQVAQMHAAGFEIGAHTHTHPNLARLSKADARREIVECKRRLEDAVGAEVTSFAYPFGKRHIHYTPATVDLVRESSYRAAAAVAFRAISGRGAVRIYEVPRFFITRGDSPTQFRQKVAGHFDWLGTFQELSPSWMKALVSPEEQY